MIRMYPDLSTETKPNHGILGYGKYRVISIFSTHMLCIICIWNVREIQLYKVVRMKNKGTSDSSSDILWILVCNSWSFSDSSRHLASDIFSIWKFNILQFVSQHIGETVKWSQYTSGWNFSNSLSELFFIFFNHKYKISMGPQNKGKIYVQVSVT